MAHYEKDETKSPNQPAGRISTYAERVSASLNPGVNTPIECEECGSTFFISSHANQYSGGGYGSAEYREITGSPIPVRVCLCGNPIIPTAQNFGGSRALGPRQEFQLSANMAKNYRQKNQALLDQVAETTPSLQEHEELKAEFELIKAKLEELLSNQAPAAKDNVAKKKKATVAGEANVKP